MEIKLKKCKGTGKAKGFKACGEDMILKETGLCSNCHRKWLIKNQTNEKTY
jgi:RecJ-like exonuclease